MLQNLIVIFRSLDKVYQQAYIRFYHSFVETGWMYGLPVIKYFLKVRNLVYWLSTSVSLYLCFVGLHITHTIFSSYSGSEGFTGLKTTLPWGVSSLFEKSSTLLQQAYWEVTLGFDFLALGLIFLTVTVFPLCFFYVVERSDRHFWAVYLLLTELLIIAAFSVIDILVFFIIFDILIYPMYKFIVGWGSAGQLRLTAARSFVIYTVLGSILLLFVIVVLASMFQTTDLLVLYTNRNYIPEHLVIPLFIAFATKVPTFPFYHWLTLAHVEASTVGSVILAALILKLGGYGFIRFLFPLFKDSDLFNQCRGLTYALFTISILLSAVAALAQTDMKRIVAYSSIEHMNLSIIGLFIGTDLAVTGSYGLIIAHGWVSAGLFFAVGSLYDRHGQRDLLYYRGYASVDGWWSILFGLLLLANVGFPLTLNFFGELQILFSLLGLKTMILPFIFVVMMSNVAYSLKLASVFWGSRPAWFVYPQNIPYGRYGLKVPEIFSLLRREGVLAYIGTYLCLVYKAIFHRSMIVLLLGVPLSFTILSSTTYYYPVYLHFLEENLTYWNIL